MRTLQLAVSLLAIVILGCGRNPSTPATTGNSAGAEEYDEQAAIKAAQAIDASMIGYHEEGSFPTPVKQPRALAADSNGHIYVGGDRTIIRHAADGKTLAEFELRGEPTCLAVGGPNHVHPGRIYVGMSDHVEVYAADGKRLAAWAVPGANAAFTSIAATDKEVWVADAGSRLVWRYDDSGHALPPVGRPNGSKEQRSFVITSHYFDLAAGTDDLVYVINPRRMRVEGYTPKGDFETEWGDASPSVAGFFGCCNPAHLAVLPDGRFVTGEKGIPRVKIYSQSGKFETVVAGPGQLAETPADLAADSSGRVLVLDGRAAKVRVYVKNPIPGKT